jgi:hypothetical protein
MEIRMLKQSDIAKCPMYVFLPSHYRDDGSCRCNETSCETDGCMNHKFNGEIYCFNHLRAMGEYEDWVICPYCKDPLDLDGEDYVRSAMLDEPVHRDCMIDADDGEMP